MADEKGKRDRWLEFLQQYEINPIQKAGKSNTMAMADYLSRVGADGHLVATLQAQMKEGCLGQETGPVFDLKLIRQNKKDEKELEIVMRLLEKGQNQRENIQENITDDMQSDIAD